MEAVDNSMNEGKRVLGPVEVFTFEVRPYLYGGPDGMMQKTLKIMVQVNGEQFTTERMMPMQPANKTEIEYYTDRALHVLHGLMEDWENDKAAKEADAAKAAEDKARLG